MPPGAEWDDTMRFSDREDDAEDVGFGGSSFDDEDEDESGWGSTKHREDLWDEPEEASLDDEEEVTDHA